MALPKMQVNVVLDIAKTKLDEPDTIVLRQGERDSTVINACIKANGKPYDLTGSTVEFHALRSDGKRVGPEHGTVRIASEPEGKVSYTVPAELAGTVGTVSLAYFKIIEDGAAITTRGLAFAVLREADITKETAEKYKSIIDSLKEQMEGVIADANAQKAEQQAAWEAQAKRQEDEFQAAERGRDELSGTATDRANTAAGRAEDAAKEIEDGIASGAYQASVTVGRAEELPPWSAPTVEDSGTGRDAVLDFGIPGTPDFEFQAETLPPGSPATMRADREEATGKVVVHAGIPAGQPGVEGTALTLDPGYFHMAVDQDGHLILTHNDNEPAPPLSIRDGRLVYTIS